MRLGLFGGSFDPIHCGHLLLAELCREDAMLDQVWFLPAFRSPHKLNQVGANAEQRLEMLQLAVGGHPDFVISTLETSRSEVSYTVDTLRQIKKERPDAELFFLMGADSLVDLPTWREPDQICRLCNPLVVQRAGSPAPNFDALREFVSSDRLDKLSAGVVSMPIVELSSREIRRRVSEGRTIRYQTPRAVEKFIEAQGLYR